MANTYTQIYIHIVFSVKNRKNLISSSVKETINKFITGIVKNRKCKLLSINSMPDHIHILIAMHPETLLSSLVREIKSSTSKFINDKKYLKFKFQWQEGFGAFSYSHSHVEAVKRYIQHQEEHHRIRSFNEEYLDLLEKFNVKYDLKYVFEKN